MLLAGLFPLQENEILSGLVRTATALFWPRRGLVDCLDGDATLITLGSTDGILVH